MSIKPNKVKVGTIYLDGYEVEFVWTYDVL